MSPFAPLSRRLARHALAVAVSPLLVAACSSAPPEREGDEAVAQEGEDLTISPLPRPLPWWYFYQFDPGHSVATQHNDPKRTGAFLGETTLTPANVNAETFGRLYTRSVNGYVRAQPLYAHQMAMPDGTRKNVLIVGTSEGDLYGFDTDVTDANPAAGRLWKTPWTITPRRDQCGEIPGGTAITATPVLDPFTNRLYVVTKGKVSDADRAGEMYISAINAATGAVIQRVKIAASARGVTFNPDKHNARPGLLLQGGHVYVGFGTWSCDDPTFQGWIMSFDASDLSVPPGAWVSSTVTGDSRGSGIWQSGNGLVGDGAGNIYFETGNGYNSSTTPSFPDRYGDSFVKLHQEAGNALSLVTHHQAADAQALLLGDTDLSSGGPMLVPGTSRLIGGGKDGRLYVLDSTSLSRLQLFNAFDDSYGDCTRSQYPQDEHNGPNIHGGPIFWKSSADSGLLYGWSEKDHLKAYRYHFSTGALDETTTASGLLASPRRSMPGGFLSLSANGQTNGIVWASVGKTDGMWTTPSSRLAAFDANDLHELWRDDSEVAFAKFTPPTVANGKVFRATADGKIIVYGPTPAPAGSDGWPVIGGPASKLYMAGYGQFATGPGGGNIYRHDETNPTGWTLVGGPGASFAVNDVGLFGLTPDRGGVFSFNGQPLAWTWIGGAAQELIAGGRSLYASSPGNAAIYYYNYLNDGKGCGVQADPTNQVGTWTRVGGAGRQWVATRTTLYGLSPDGSGVYRYSGTPNVWYQVGGPAAKLYAGTDTLYATNPTTGDIYRYEGTPWSWTHVGGPGADFAASSATLYGLSPDRSGLWRFTGTPDSWTNIYGPASALYAGGDHVAVVDPATGNLREWTSR
jgi:hypothetical protein